MVQRERGPREMVSTLRQAKLKMDTFMACDSSINSKMTEMANNKAHPTKDDRAQLPSHTMSWRNTTQLTLCPNKCTLLSRHPPRKTSTAWSSRGPPGQRPNRRSTGDLHRMTWATWLREALRVSIAKFLIFISCEVQYPCRSTWCMHFGRDGHHLKRKVLPESVTGALRRMLYLES